jgi:hypothetical protein
VSLTSAHRLGPAIGLGLLLTLAALPGIGRADEDDDNKKKNNNETQQSTSKNKKNTANQSSAPDLEVTGLTLLTNALGQVSEREVMFRVANIGSGDAPATTARIEITGPVVNVSGSSAAVVRTVSVPALQAGGNPFYGTAELPGICDGHIVTVSVDLRGDTSAGNNSAGPTKVCPELPPPSAGGVGGTLDQARRQGTGLSLPNPGAQNTVDYGDAAVIPEHMRRGTHTLVFEPSASVLAVKTTSGGVTGDYLVNRDDNPVGWAQKEEPLGYKTMVAQIAVKFDLGPLDELPRKIVTGALLTFDEQALYWTDSEGHDRFVAGCVAVLGTATVDWASQPGINALIPNQEYDNVIPGASREWDVTDHVQQELRYKSDAPLRYGYVLRGALEDVEGDDDTSCMSRISNIRLRVTYDVPAN